MTTELHPRGVFCAALTPLTADLAPDHARFVAHCRRMLEEGCDGIALLGTTGEANSFSADERKALLEATVAAGIAPERLLPGTGVAARNRASRFAQMASLKALLAQRTGDEGWRRMRPPLLRLSAEEASALLEA